MFDSLIRSLLTIDNPFNSTEDIVAWVAQRNQEVSVQVECVPFNELKNWRFDESTGDLCHVTGRFFSITGLDVRLYNGRCQQWQQPIISQPEVGVLGILAYEEKGVLYFLLQAKIEPGNVNCVQLSPTVQATRSNYMQVHGGRKPAYLDYFLSCRPDQVIIDQLQSEQGARFLRKRNRNMIVRLNEYINPGPDFRWLTLAQIRQLALMDNMINMDTRTVLSGLRFGGERDMPAPNSWVENLLCSERVLAGMLSIDGILHRLSVLKSKYELFANRIELNKVNGWRIREDEISRDDDLFFKVIGVNVEIDNREVKSWCQPLIQPMQEGLCVLFAKFIDGVLHFLLQAKVECGNFDVVELAPTIQCLTGSYTRPFGYVPTYLQEFLSGECVERVLMDTRQSEEGGRFFHEQNRNVVCLVDDSVGEHPPENFLWLTLGQIKEFLRFNNYLNIQVRSLVSMLPLWERC